MDTHITVEVDDIGMIRSKLLTLIKQYHPDLAGSSEFNYIMTRFLIRSLERVR